MSSSARRLFLGAIVVSFPFSCASAPDNLFSSGGSAGASNTGGAQSKGGTSSGGAATTGGNPIGTGGNPIGTGGNPIGTGGNPIGSGGDSSKGGALTGGSLATGGTGGQLATLNLELSIEKTTDDCTWISGTQERLRFSDSEATLEVGTDAEMGRAGFRFTLPLAAGARISTAILRVYRVGGETSDADTLAVQVFDIANVAPYDATHMHGPEGHASGGLWATKVGGMPAGKASQFTQSPNLAALVQHVLDKPEWLPGGAVGFVLSPETMSGWASYADSSGGVGKATLRLSYVPR